MSRKRHVSKSFLFEPSNCYGFKMTARGFPNQHKRFGIYFKPSQNRFGWIAISYRVYCNLLLNRRYGRVFPYKEEGCGGTRDGKSVRLNLFEPDWCAEEEKKSLYHDDLPTGVWE